MWLVKGVLKGLYCCYGNQYRQENNHNLFTTLLDTIIVAATGKYLWY